MKQRNLYIVLAVIVLAVVAVVYFSMNSKPAAPAQLTEEVKLTEMPVTEIAMSGPASTPEAEFSG
ncbi:MAG TPA: hypothetical protein PL000_22425, partial [Anaerolineales bacterium]|nr:hypothetical protein [Anaerolineales bacterium]